MPTSVRRAQAGEWALSGLRHLAIRGYRPFDDFRARPGALTVLVGTNGSGKTSLFEFLRFVRDLRGQEPPPEIVPRSIGQRVFHVPGPERLGWTLEIGLEDDNALTYEGEVLGPVGSPRLSPLKLSLLRPLGTRPDTPGGAVRGMSLQDLEALVSDRRLTPEEMWITREGRALASYLDGWRFYSPSDLRSEAARTPAIVETRPALNADGSNLAAVLFWLQTEHAAVFRDLCFHLRQFVTGFQNLQARVVMNGRVMAFWREDGVPEELTLADLSAGTFEALCWLALALHPAPPSLVCLDEPDVGLHPRTLTVLAGLLRKLSQRTQVIVATHSSFFLGQFALDEVGVMKRERGSVQLSRPADSAALRAMLEDFGAAALADLHRSQELEALS